MSRFRTFWTFNVARGFALVDRKSFPLRLRHSFFRDNFWLTHHSIIVIVMGDVAIVATVIAVVGVDRCQRGVIFHGIRVHECIIYQRIVQSHNDIRLILFYFFLLSIALLSLAIERSKSFLEFFVSKGQDFWKFYFLPRAAFLLFLAQRTFDLNTTRDFLSFFAFEELLNSPSLRFFK